MTRDAGRDVEKVLNSAIANAEANHGLAGDDLYVSAAHVGAGPTLKRWRARARGRVARIRKRTCHITIELAEAGEEAATSRAARTADGQTRGERKPKSKPATGRAQEATAPETAADEEATHTEEPAKAKVERGEAKKEKPKRAARKKNAGEES